MIVARREVKKLRQPHQCDFCLRMVTENAIRYFGFAEKGDPAYDIYMHANCERLKDEGYTKEDLDSSNPYNQGDET